MISGNFNLSQNITSLILSIIPSDSFDETDEMKEIQIFATSDENYLGSAESFWFDLEPVDEKFSFGNISNIKSFDFSLVKKSNLCDEKKAYKSVYDCIAYNVFSVYSNLCQNVCLTKDIMAYKLFDNMINTIPNCATFEEHKCMMTHKKTAISQLQKRCAEEKVCHIIEYKAKTNVYDTPLLENYHGFNMMLSSSALKSVVYEEYLIYDFWTMVGYVGGSLGLFVVFSIFDYICQMIDFVQSKMK